MEGYKDRQQKRQKLKAYIAMGEGDGGAGGGGVAAAESEESVRSKVPFQVRDLYTDSLKISPSGTNQAIPLAIHPSLALLRPGAAPLTLYSTTTTACDT